MPVESLGDASNVSQSHLKDICVELLWELEKPRPSMLFVISRLREIESQSKDKFVSVIEDEQSLRIRVKIGRVKAEHVLKTPLKLKWWNKPAYKTNSESMENAWFDLRVAIRAFLRSNGLHVIKPKTSDLLINLSDMAKLFYFTNLVDGTLYSKHRAFFSRTFKNDPQFPPPKTTNGNDEKKFSLNEVKQYFLESNAGARCILDD